MKTEIKKQSRASLKILNSKEKKQIVKLIKEQWGCDFKSSMTFLLSSKSKLYLINSDFAKVPLDNLRVDHLGAYFGELLTKNNDIRLSIEGTELIGPIAKKNLIKVNREDMRSWLKGKDLGIESDFEGFVILKYENDFLGCGRSNRSSITNFIPKNRRILCDD